jgi:hypothetical protein
MKFEIICQFLVKFFSVEVKKILPAALDFVSCKWTDRFSEFTRSAAANAPEPKAIVYLSTYLQTYQPTHQPTYLPTYLPIYVWLYSPLLDLGRFFSFLILYAVGRTPWTGDQPIARPLPTHRTTQTQKKSRHPCLKWDSNPQSQCLRGAKTVHVLDRADTVVGESGHRLYEF